MVLSAYVAYEYVVYDMQHVLRLNQILLIVFDDIHLLKLQNDDLRSRGYLGALIAPGNEARYP